VSVVYPKYRPRTAKSGAVVRPAVNILRAMGRLLARRHRLECNRHDFLRRWGKLRRELACTPEYQAVRSAVQERADGLCERCGNAGSVMHHERLVSWEPQHALDPQHCQWVCRQCHKGEHPWLD